MAETTQETSRYSRCEISATIWFVVFCMAAGTTCLVLVFAYFCPDCRVPADSTLVIVYWFTAIVFFILGLLTLAKLVRYKLRRQDSSTTRAVLSIPAEDLETSVTPVLPYIHIPDRQPLFNASSMDLPDYFTVIQNVGEAYSQFVDAEDWSEDFPETPPPSYEQALEMTTFYVGDTEDTRL